MHACSEDAGAAPGAPPTRMIVFSTFTSALNLLERRLAATGIDWVRLDGSMPIQDRTEAVREFAHNPQVRARAQPPFGLSARLVWLQGF